jgi:hypothetical protein
MGVDQDLMPISMLKKDTIDEALGLLKGISGLLKDLKEVRSKGMQADL